MKSKFWITFLILVNTSVGAFAADYIFTAAVPTEVHMVAEGLVVYGDFSDEGVTCSTGGTGRIFLPNTDANFDHKVSMALMAYAAGKQIEVLLYTGPSSECKIISAAGSVPQVHHYYWRLKDQN